MGLLGRFLEEKEGSEGIIMDEIDFESEMERLRVKDADFKRLMSGNNVFSEKAPVKRFKAPQSSLKRPENELSVHPLPRKRPFPFSRSEICSDAESECNISPHRTKKATEHAFSFINHESKLQERYNSSQALQTPCKPSLPASNSSPASARAQVTTLFTSAKGRSINVAATTVDKYKYMTECPPKPSINTLFSSGSGKRITVAQDSMDEYSALHAPENSVAKVDTLFSSGAGNRIKVKETSVERYKAQNHLQNAPNTHSLFQSGRKPFRAPLPIQKSSVEKRMHFLQDAEANSFRTPHKFSARSPNSISPMERKAEALLALNKENKAPDVSANSQSPRFTTTPVKLNTASPPKLQPMQIHVQERHRLRDLQKQARFPSLSSEAQERQLMLLKLTPITSAFVTFRNTKDLTILDSAAFQLSPSTDYFDAHAMYKLMLHRQWLVPGKEDLLPWFHSQYRWTVFKHATYELLFPSTLSNRYLTAMQVMHCIHRHFIHQILHSHRSILQKVVNGDASASDGLVLMIAAVFFPTPDESQTDLALVLSDGHVAVHAIPDSALSIPLYRIRHTLIGKRLVLWNAHMKNAGVDVFSIPLNQHQQPWTHPKDCNVPILQLHYNSTRLARTLLPLGLERTRQSAPILPFPLLSSLPLSSLQPNSGLVRCIRIILLSQSQIAYFQNSKDIIGPRVLTQSQLPLFQDMLCELEQRPETLSLTPFLRADVYCAYNPHITAQLMIWRPSEDDKLSERGEYLISHITVKYHRNKTLTLATTRHSLIQRIGTEKKRMYPSIDAPQSIQSLYRSANPSRANICVLVLSLSNPKPAPTSKLHIFVTDASLRLASLQLTSMQVSDYDFTRKKALWREKCIVCLRWLAILHRDTRFNMLSCEIREETEISSRHALFSAEHAELLELLEKPSFQSQVQSLQRYVKQYILSPTQSDAIQRREFSVKLVKIVQCPQKSTRFSSIAYGIEPGKDNMLLLLYLQPEQEEALRQAAIKSQCTAIDSKCQMRVEAHEEIVYAEKDALADENEAVLIVDTIFWLHRYTEEP